MQSKSISTKLVALGAITLLVLAAKNASAANIFFGEDINRTATGNNEDATRVLHPNSDAAQTAFLANLVGVGTETFEGFAPNTNVTSLTFGLDTASLSPALQVFNIPTGTLNGVYPISGNQFLLQNVGVPNTFSINFSTPQAAFGFYVTDLEVPGNLSLSFLLADGTSHINRPVPSTAQGTAPNNNTGSVAYYGLIDTTNPFIGVSFVRSLNSNDGFGFDDMTVARAAQVVPDTTPSVVSEPETLSIVALSLAILGFSRRRQNRMMPAAA